MGSFQVGKFYSDYDDLDKDNYLKPYNRVGFFPEKTYFFLSGVQKRD